MRNARFDKLELDMTKIDGRLHRLLVIWAVLVPMSAQAYVGPGMGAGVVATILGILAGLLMLIVGAVWYPLKKLYRWMRRTDKP